MKHCILKKSAAYEAACPFKTLTPPTPGLGCCYPGLPQGSRSSTPLFLVADRKDILLRVSQGHNLGRHQGFCLTQVKGESPLRMQGPKRELRNEILLEMASQCPGKGIPRWGDWEGGTGPDSARSRGSQPGLPCQPGHPQSSQSGRLQCPGIDAPCPIARPSRLLGLQKPWVQLEALFSCSCFLSPLFPPQLKMVRSLPWSALSKSSYFFYSQCLLNTLMLCVGHD